MGINVGDKGLQIVTSGAWLCLMEICVYFIQSGNVGPVKIGVAKNVQKRLDALQTGNHMELKLITKIICEGMVHAYAMEKKFHRKFKKYHIRGEWFYPTVLSFMLPKENKRLDVEHLSRLQSQGLL